MYKEYSDRLGKVTVGFKSLYPLDLKQLKVYGGLFLRVNAKKDLCNV